MKALSLFSGGLDSILATKLIMDQGIEVEAVNFCSAFCQSTKKDACSSVVAEAARRLGVKLVVIDINKELFDIVRNPRHGYGKNLNPCIDCRIFTFKRAGKRMKDTGASFLVTGEVLGERPMSQRKEAIYLIEKESAQLGNIVRPLSAKLLNPSIAEQKGWVSRKKLFDISGRSRKPQIAMAKKFGIDYYPPPSGGCLLTYEGFSNKMRDLMDAIPMFGFNDIEMLKIGRVFKVGPKAILFVGKDKETNEKLINLSRKGDYVFKPVGTAGPVGIGRGAFDASEVDAASVIVAKYCDNNGKKGLKATVNNDIIKILQS